MPEKIAIGISAAVAAAMSTILAMWAKFNFAKRSEVFKPDGEPIYQRIADCRTYQSVCGDRMCAKILEIKVGQQDMRRELYAIGRTISRIEQWMTDKNNIVPKI